MTGGVFSMLVAGAVLAFTWALLSLLAPSPLAGRARRLKRVVARAGLLAAMLDRIVAGVAARASQPTLRRAALRAQAAGWTAPDAGARLVAATWLLPPVLLVAGAALLRGVSDPVQVVAVLGLLGLAGWLGPDLLATNMAARRLLAIGRGLPDPIDLLVICAESGLSLDVALARSARELAPAQPALAAELQATEVELGFLPHRADAFANLGKCVPLAQVAALGDMLVQTERFGTPLAQALRVMAAEYRTGRLLRAEERAARLPALMTVPMIAFILPPLFVVLIGPAVIGALAK